MTAFPDPGNVPLSLYVHIPWCVRKCPYCDFNSHELKQALPEQDYVEALLRDLRQQREFAAGRKIQSVVIGGGTPSLFSGGAVMQLLQGIRALCHLSDQVEITLEANPGAVDAVHFAEYLEAGVNRLSIGVQSFNAGHLDSLGRIHSPQQAVQAMDVAKQAGFKNINLDLMFGLPQQTLQQALHDLQQAMVLSPQHLSWYQLTIEPNTRFHHQPPPTPEDDLLWEMQQQGQALLEKEGYGQYEISAYSLPGSRCRHNLNYWMFGDYLAIGAGAHGKVSTPQGVMRYSRLRHPQAYMQAAEHKLELRPLSKDDLQLEFMMNAMRLNDGVPVLFFEQRTAMMQEEIAQGLEQAQQLGLMQVEMDRYCSTPKGRTYLNNLLMLFDSSG